MATGFTKEIEKVENYEKAKLDNFLGWNIHHRLETHTSEGIKRLVQITKEELIALDMYFDRPANELIYLTIPEHTSVHCKGRKCSEEQKRKTSKTLMGHTVSESTYNKLSKTFFKKGSKVNPEMVQKRVETRLRHKKVLERFYEEYKAENKVDMKWNQFLAFYKTHKYLFGDIEQSRK